MKTLILALAALLTAGIATAQDTGAEQTAAPGLSGSQWQLIAMSAADTDTPLVPGSAVTLDFTSDTELSGSGGCNSYNAGYTANNGAIAVSPVASTKMACADEALTAQESAYIAALQTATGYRLTNSRLTLTSDDGSTLHFAARGAFALIGSEWQLTSFGLPDAQTPVPGENPVTLQFTGAADVGASGGCNSMGSTYTAADETLTIEQGPATLMACDDATMQVESAYFALLPTVVSYEISGDHLTLTTSDGQLLHFTAAGEYALTRTEWELTLLLVEGDMAYLPVEGSRITLQFASDGTVVGSGGCNSYGGGYTLEGDSLTFTEILSTLMACVDEMVMAQESRYFEALNAVVRYEIDGGTLTLFTADNTSLQFAAVGDPLAPDEA